MNPHPSPSTLQPVKTFMQVTKHISTDKACLVCGFEQPVNHSFTPGLIAQSHNSFTTVKNKPKAGSSLTKHQLVQCKRVKELNQVLKQIKLGKAMKLNNAAQMRLVKLPKLVHCT